MVENWIPTEQWETIVRNVPIVSVDLVVQAPEGVVLGKRVNEPAEGEWFVPGGRVHKGERLREAVVRLSKSELGVDDVSVVESLGGYEHIYETSEIDDESGKHYLANGFVVETNTNVSDMTACDQHSDLRAFDAEKISFDLHEYTAAYLADADTIDYPTDEHV